MIWTAREDGPLPAGVMPPSPKGARFSRAEGRRDCLCGAMVIPGHPPFGYAVTADTVVFLDSGGTVRPCLKQMEKEKSWREPGLGVFLYDLWELLLDGDLRALEALEQRIDKLENAVLSGTSGAFHQRRGCIAGQAFVKMPGLQRGKGRRCRGLARLGIE